MKQFMDESFMLSNDTAVKLYNDYAKDMPIFDYHCHLSPQMIYEDKPFENITQIFLGGDHYKWRYMRSCGVDEEYITGSAPAREKFRAFCSCLQYAIGNPLYHWTHLELKRYFGIDDVVTADNADDIYDRANKVIADTQMSPAKLINGSNVAVICTTDDPADDLRLHKLIAEKGHVFATVLPAFRPDRMINIDREDFVPYVKTLSNAAATEIGSYKSLIAAATKRIDYFNDAGCRISDHALDTVEYAEGTDDEREAVFKKAMSGSALTSREIAVYKTGVMLELMKKYAELGWVSQLHMGALRNNNTRMYEKLGADVGFDSINDPQIAPKLSALLNAADMNGCLPKTILYTLNPKDNYVIGTMLGNFQGGGIPGKIQFGSGWWFNDQRDGMTEQMKALANLGALWKFVGMLTDSRSFLSYTRHEYFRRIMCNLLGEWVENGEFPADYDTLGTIVKGIAFNNARDYFGIEIKDMFLK